MLLLGQVALKTHFKSLQEPALEEGFFRVDLLPFQLVEAEQPEAARLQRMYLE